jgi:DNA replication factor GINS
LDYTKLYEAWKSEEQNDKLQPLDKRFFQELSELISTNIEELQMLDNKTLRARLVAEEKDKIEKLFKDLIWTRVKKIIMATFDGTSLSTDLLTSEEEVIYRDALSSFDKISRLEKYTLRGKASKFLEDKNKDKRSKIVLLRFLSAIPTIIGPNAKTYGPFKAEDVAAIPIENAESLIRRGLALKVNIE